MQKGVACRLQAMWAVQAAREVHVGEIAPNLVAYSHPPECLRRSASSPASLLACNESLFEAVHMLLGARTLGSVSSSARHSLVAVDSLDASDALLLLNSAKQLPSLDGSVPP